jgi:hypothetical protein
MGSRWVRDIQVLILRCLIFDFLADYCCLCYLGVAFEDVWGRLFPVVGLGPGASVRANFGKTPFQYVEPGKEKDNERKKALQRRRTRDLVGDNHVANYV